MIKKNVLFPNFKEPYWKIGKETYKFVGSWCARLALGKYKRNEKMNHSESLKKILLPHWIEIRSLMVSMPSFVCTRPSIRGASSSLVGSNSHRHHFGRCIGTLNAPYNRPLLLQRRSIDPAWRWRLHGNWSPHDWRHADVHVLTGVRTINDWILWSRRNLHRPMGCRSLHPRPRLRHLHRNIEPPIRYARRLIVSSRNGCSMLQELQISCKPTW